MSAPVPVTEPVVSRHPYSSASLYVGDLHPDVHESALVDAFSHIGPILSVRVCRDSATHRSLGYGYVNFSNYEDAERALALMNHKEINGKPCRVMWSQRDPAARKTGLGNLYIKNLPDSLSTTEKLSDKFSTYGNVLSTRVATDSKGQLLDYGFVHFESPEIAERVLNEWNGRTEDGKTIRVEFFKPARERGVQSRTTFTNVFVKNLPEEWTKEDLENFFKTYGTITSAHLAVDEEKGVSKCFGFVNFGTVNEAANALEGANNAVVGESKKHIYVARAQKKEERQRFLHERNELSRQERAQKSAGTNLYVKNLPDDVDDEKLRSFFSKFGNIASVHVATENGRSKGFGFVSFTTAEEASKAATEANGSTHFGKQLYVAPHQTKDQRRPFLEARMRQPKMGVSPMGYVPAAGFRGIYGRQMAWVGQPPMMAPGVPMMMPGFGLVPGRGPRPAGGRGQRQGQQGQRVPRVPRAGPAQGRPVAQAVAPPVNSHLDVASLARLPAEEAKRILGDRLYHLVAEIRPDYAPKITGMLLGMEIPDVLDLLDSQADLVEKVNEAYNLLVSESQ